MIKRLVAFSIFLYAYTCSAQILDDSTKQVYGPRTSLYFLEEDVLEDNGRMRVVDTSLHTFHRYRLPNTTRFEYQNLGVSVTALRPLWFDPPAQIGTQLGINVYDPYAFKPEDIRYYDSKSPFTQVHYVQGTTGDQFVRFRFTRSIDSLKNIGIDYIRFNTDYIFGGDPAASSNIVADQTKINAHASIKSKNLKYHLLFHFAHLNAKANETGGIDTLRVDENGNVSIVEDFFELNDLEAALGIAAQSQQTQNRLRVFQQYKLDRGFTVFNITEYYRQKDNYEDPAIQDHFFYYPGSLVFLTESANQVPGEARRLFNFNADQTEEETYYTHFENKAGVKGVLLDKFNYQAYFRSRIYNWDSNRQEDSLLVVERSSAGLDSLAKGERIATRLNGLENFVGGTLFYQFTDSIRLTAEAELQLGDNYRLQGLFTSNFFRLGFLSTLYAPTLIQRRFVSNHFLWDNSFSNTLVNKVFGGISVRLPNLRFSPYGSYTIINNYIYFNEEALPQQSNQATQQLQVGLDFSYRLGRLVSEIEARYTGVLNNDVIRPPGLQVMGSLYCDNCLLRQLLESQIGIEMYFRTNYFGKTYTPVSKQFYLQDAVRLDAYPVVDVYANFRVKTFRIFLKLIHANQPISGGYLSTPIYPAMPFAFTFGVDWMFFN